MYHLFISYLQPKFEVLKLIRDKSININEFTALCTALFRNEKGI